MGATRLHPTSFIFSKRARKYIYTLHIPPRKHSCRFYRHFHVAIAGQTRRLRRISRRTAVPVRRRTERGRSAGRAEAGGSAGRALAPGSCRPRSPPPLPASPGCGAPTGGGGRHPRGGGSAHGGGTVPTPSHPASPPGGCSCSGGEGAAGRGRCPPAPRYLQARAGGAVQRSRCPPFIKANRSGPRPCPAAASASPAPFIKGRRACALAPRCPPIHRAARPRVRRGARCPPIHKIAIFPGSGCCGTAAERGSR